MTDVFAIQDEISQAIAEKLRVRLAGDRSLVKGQTENLEAFNLYLKGRYFGTKPEASALAKGKECYEQAIAIDPKYAKAWYGLASFYLILGNVGMMPTNVANAQCSQAVHKALALDEMLPEAHAIKAMLRIAEFDWAGAEQGFRRALELGPEASDVWGYYSLLLVAKQRFDEALAATRRALELDPLTPFLHVLLGFRYFQNRQYDQAIQQLRNALELDPNYLWVHVHLGFNFIQVGKLEEAVNEIETVSRYPGITTLWKGECGFLYAQVGRIGEAHRVLDELQRSAQQTIVPAICFAMVYFGLGEMELAFDWFDKAVDETDVLMLDMIFSPLLDSLRSDPRYHALLRRMNLES